VNTIDPGVRIGQSQLRKVATLRDQVANGAVAGNALTLNVDLGTTAIGQYEQLLSIPTVPRGLAGALGSLNSALMGFQRALQTLLSADGPSAAEALSRVDTILSQSKATYDAALTSIYAGTGVTPALVSLTRFQSTPPANTVSTHPIRLHLLAFC